MKKTMLKPTVIILLCVAIGLFAYTYAISPDEKPDEKSCHGKGALSEIADKVNIEVSNIDDGVSVTFTSTDTDAIKILQEYFAIMKEKGLKGCPGMFSCGKSGGCKEMCGHKKDTEECKKAHEDGDCKGHDATKDAHHESSGCTDHGQKAKNPPEGESNEKSE